MSDNKEKTEGMMLEEQLVWKFPHIGKDAPEQVEAAAEFCEGYKAFLDEGKNREGMCGGGSKASAGSRIYRV